MKHLNSSLIRYNNFFIKKLYLSQLDKDFDFPAVYIWYGKELYVGKTKNLHQRISSHHIKENFLYYIKFTDNNQGKIDFLEDTLISLFTKELELTNQSLANKVQINQDIDIILDKQEKVKILQDINLLLHDFDFKYNYKDDILLRMQSTNGITSLSKQIKVGDINAFSTEYHSYLLSQDDFDNTDDYLGENPEFLFIRNGFLINHLTKKMIGYWNTKNLNIITVPQSKDDKRIILDIEGCTNKISYLDYDKFESFNFNNNDFKNACDFDIKELSERACDISLESLNKESL